jgi:DNA-binding GntR family transcriptional regulator
VTVYDSLRALVMAGGIGDEERVAESHLARELGVSRTPVREALQRLEGDGLVMAQGRGIRLRTLRAHELAQLYSARAALEGWAACEVAQRVARGELAPAQLATLDTLADETHTLTSSGDLARAVEANRAFHEAIVALADNAVITETLRRWWDQIVISTRRSLKSPARIHQVQSEHDALLLAVRAGDSAAARTAAEAHILRTRDALNRDHTQHQE